ncbi:hypothetical protein BT96DRAFT_997126 [Gymnopus androsaceus JB14]|uniref:Uncharacterized protein n=1 Tax=Gymnopus androsaceus JB14 TaxID=1447944 RepID=A0A6A4HGN6_9AGAR|nr:hypothetical protein BT96DRAFT_997126 [Gymnopus androsaceus JB14]
MPACLDPGLECKQTESFPHFAKSKDLHEAETEFMDCVKALKDCNRLRGDIPRIDDLLDPCVEREDADSAETDNFAQGGLGLCQIVEYVRKRPSGKDDDGDSEGPELQLDHCKALEAAELLKQVCANCGDLECSLDLSKFLHKF